MTVKKMKPEIRFKGFTDEWEWRRLDCIYNKIRNAFVGTATPYYVKDGHFYLESNNIKDGQINRNTEIFINDEFYLKQKENWLHTGDIVMVQSGHVGHSAVIPQALNNTAAHALIIFTDLKEKTNPHFLNYQFQTRTSRKELDKITTGNTIKHILSSDMKEYIVPVTKSEEQDLIGSFFQNLDTLITLHQRKYDKLRTVKKAMLEKMFPKDGADVPEIRFKGFTGKWDKWVLGELCMIGDIDHRMPQSVNDGIPYVMTGDFIGTNDFNFKNSKRISIDDYEQLSRKIKPEKGDIIFARYASVGAVRYIETQIKFLVSYSCAIIKHNDTYNGKYLFYFLQADVTQRQIELEINTGSQRNIGIDSLKKLIILLPGKIEQEKVATFFTDLDNLINLHQQELDKLKTIKKSCLEKMFV